MTIRRLVQIESSGLLYDQAGFDMETKDDRLHDSLDHTIYYPGEGTNTSNILYLGNTTPNAHWIGLHNCGTEIGAEVISLLATSLVGDDFAQDGKAADYNVDTNYLEIAPGDIIYGKFSKVGMLKTDGAQYYDRLRLIRGV